jgi:hypothetical protein
MSLSHIVVLTFMVVVVVVEVILAMVHGVCQGASGVSVDVDSPRLGCPSEIIGLFLELEPRASTLVE